MTSDAAIAAQRAMKIEQLPPKICVQAPPYGSYAEKNTKIDLRQKTATMTTRRSIQPLFLLKLLTTATATAASAPTTAVAATSSAVTAAGRT